jgi:hypothetical protein
LAYKVNGHGNYKVVILPNKDHVSLPINSLIPQNLAHKVTCRHSNQWREVLMFVATSGQSWVVMGIRLEHYVYSKTYTYLAYVCVCVCLCSSYIKFCHKFTWKFPDVPLPRMATIYKCVNSLYAKKKGHNQDRKRTCTTHTR